MNYQDLRIIFMGTPEFAVASLEALIVSGCKVVAVVTAPDKPAGRGMKLTESAVKKSAVAHNIPVLQPVKLKDEMFLRELRALDAHLQVVVAFRMLPEAVWNMPPMGTINVHGSLLPAYRGAAPINWAIINGEKVTGVTTFKLKHEIDTGDILLQQEIPIEEKENAGSLHDKMKRIGAELLVQTVRELAAGSLTEKPQQQLKPTSVTGAIPHAPKIFTETCEVHWTWNVDRIYNLVRGLSPYPGAFTQLNNKMLKIYDCDKEVVKHNLEPGTVRSNHPSQLSFAAADGFIHVKELQLEGKKRMMAADFLRGYRLH